jgi:hypothetical protein
MKKILSVFVLSAWIASNPVIAAKKTPEAPKPAVGNASVFSTTSIGLPQIAATAYLVKDLQSNQIIAEKNLNQQIEPASLTKLMTAYLTFKALEEGKLKPDQMLTASDKAWKAEGSRMFLEKGKPVLVSDLVKGLIVQSGNDAAITLAEAIAGSEAAFAVMMNAEAKRLGMSQTNFENSTGLPGKTHLTTVNDLATLSAAIIHDFPQYYGIYSLKEFTYNNITQPNRNLLLYRDPDVDGLKTGHTNSAGYNLIASSKRGGRRVLSVVVGTASPEARATESSKLLNYALQEFDTPKMYQANQTITEVKMYKGAENTVPIGFLNDAYVTISHGNNAQIKPILETVQPVLAPVKKGQELGVLKLVDGDKIITEQKVVALKDVEEAGFFRRMWDSIILWFKMMFED